MIHVSLYVVQMLLSVHISLLHNLIIKMYTVYIITFIINSSYNLMCHMLAVFDLFIKTAGLSQ